MAQTILVADDEPKIVSLVSTYLIAAGFQVLSAANGKEALGQFAIKKLDAVILDINMPLLDGIEVARSIRKSSDIPILFLSARAEEIDRILGLELGADDYITKPFSPRELVARVKAVLRRIPDRDINETPQQKNKNILTSGFLSLDLSKREVTLKKKTVILTAAQFDILAFMMSQPGRVWTRLDLLEASRGTAFDGYERTIDAQIKNIRKALHDNSLHPVFIQTIRGFGYKFLEPDLED